MKSFSGYSESVGVVIVVYNRREELSKLLNSLQEQTYKNFDVLIVDDHSTDDLNFVKEFSFVEYLRLDQNIGFVSGLRVGIERLLSKEKYKYIWILDSDLEVASSALYTLVTIFNDDRDIALAGCVIYNSFDREVVVEAGADVNLQNGVVTARFCNERLPEMDEVADVDFVASGGGGSLLSVEIFKHVGMYDNRYFFLWEDVDFGLSIKRAGFRVVVARDAVVWHPPFTEKRNPNIYAYYGVRNPFLTVSNHCRGFYLLWCIFGNLRRYLRIALLVSLSGRERFAVLSIRGLYDFFIGKFGKAECENIEALLLDSQSVKTLPSKTVFILGLADIDVVDSAVDWVKINSDCRIVLVAQSYRVSLLKGVNVDSVVTYDERLKNAVGEYLRLGIHILRQGGCIVNTDLKVTSPLNYFSKNVYDWDDTSRQLYKSRQNIFTAWKPLVSVVVSDVSAVFLTPFVWLASMRNRSFKTGNK